MFRRKKARTREGKPVEVNQRALIHKILARYPGEFTVFRELLQNSDDAHSSTVEIHFETATSRVTGVDPPIPPNPKLSDVREHGLVTGAWHSRPDFSFAEAVRWTFKNDGKLFTQNDWTRLAKIAEGNPDPETVGAFGVGFYSLFSVTDRPSVSSGRQQMELYWKDGNDQLYIRQVDLPSRQPTSPWTIIEIPLRERRSMSETIDFIQFLATSITFMVHLKHVSIWFNRHCIGRVRKEFLAPAEAVELPIRMERSSPSRMVVNGIQRHRFTIQAEIETSIKTRETSSTEVFKSCEHRDLPSASQSLPLLETPSLPLQTENSTCSCTAKLGLTVFSAEVDVKEDEKLSREVIRCIAKKPPSRLKYSLVYTGKEEYDRSFANLENQPLGSIFQGLRADLNGALHPRIFIGHSTSQTTGFGGHMASSFIPTVERESVDLVNAPIWNGELLYVGGFLSRIVYESELSAIQTLWERATEHHSASDLQPPLELQNQLRQHFIHILKFFTFHHSTPSPKVAQRLRESFYTCSNRPLRFLSSVGVRHASDIRSFNPICAKFLKHVPMLSQDITQAGHGIIKALPGEHQIRTTTLSDVLQDLCEHTLDDGELVACLQWQLHHGPTSGMAELSQVARFQAADGAGIELSSIQCFIDSDGFGARVPLDGPLPPFLMPLKVTKHFTPTHLASLGWREFTIAEWLRYISQPQIMLADSRYDFTQSALWAESVLSTVSYVWSSSDEIRHLAKLVFANKNCIPTTSDLQCPEDSYLPSTNSLAPDNLYLPIVQLPSGREISAEMGSLLLALGVRRHLPPRLVLTRMVETGKWNTSDLVHYLVQEANSFTSTEFSEFRSSDAFVMEGVQKDASKTHFRADELYPPTDSFRQLQLPLIEWGKRSKWRDESPEANLLYRLGLRRYPPLDVIMELCSSQNATVSASAFEYLCTNFGTVYSDYNPDRFRDVAFVPAEKMGGTCVERLENVFLDDQWKILEFSVIRHRHWKDVIKELGVQHYPPPSSLLHLLEMKPPSNEEVARQWFEILSDYSPSFSSHELDRLSRLRIVPKTISGHRKWLPPVHCYVGRSIENTFHLKLFHFVNFGPKANHFLSDCRAKAEPSDKDIAESLIDNPERFYELVGGHEQFLQEVDRLASRHTRIPNDTLSKMRVKPVLLGLRRETTTNPDGWKNIHLLREPREIVIVDDIHAYQLFGDSLIAAPRDMSRELERFYVFLGCKYLSTTVSEQCKECREIPDTTTCSKFRDLVLQRVPFFLQQYPNHQPQFLVSWPSNPDDIVVRLWEHLSVSKTFHFGSMKTVKEQDMWATAKYEDGKIQLWLSSSAKQDMYEIAVSICRVLFGRVERNDALLLATLLSEDLDVLKRRGYEVDQVLKSQQRTEDLGLTDAASSYCSIAPETLSVSSTTLTAQHPETETSLDPMPIQPTMNSYCLPGDSEVAGVSLASSLWLPPSVTNVVNNARNAFRVATRSIMSSAELPGTVTAVLPPSPWAPRQVMPRSYIRSNVDKAIRLCNSKEGIPDHHPKDTDVTKFLNNGYCDVAEPIGNLRFVGTRENIDVYTDQDTATVDQFMERVHEPLALFIRIIIPIAKIYKLPIESLRIFYNDTAGCIAFNCKGILYLNLRYFEAWHYQDVKIRKTQRALSSWFLTFAHEIAHNLVTSHDAEHEFWFSVICEAYINDFSQLLGSASV